MAIFKKTKDPEEKVDDIRVLKTEIEKTSEVPVKKVEKSSNIPLFVKIDRYRDLLGIMNDVKSVLFLTKNTLEIQKQIETLVNENRRLIEESIKKIDERISMLDSELTKPTTSFEKISYEKPQPIVGEISDKNLENIINDLKQQIESLKSDLKNIS